MAAVTIDYLKTHGGIPLRITIDNQDGANDVVYRTNVQDTSDTLNAAPNGETEIDNLLPEAFITIIPDTSSGKGTLSADLAWPPDLVRLGWLPSGFLG